MKKTIIIFLLTIFSFNYSHAVFYPEHYSEGQIISKQEYLNYMDYCFLTTLFINPYVFDIGNESQIDLNYRLYDIDGGHMVLGYGEFIMSCLTEIESRKQYDNKNGGFVGNVLNPSTGKPFGTNQYLKRSTSDKCNGFDHFDGYWYLYGCDGSTGEWYTVLDSEPGSFDERTQDFECYNQSTKKNYFGSTYANMVICKSRFLGVESDCGYFYQTYACAEGEYDKAFVPNLVEIRSGFTTNKNISSGLNGGTGDTGGTGGTGGTGDTGGTGSNSDLEPKLNEIKSDLADIKLSNSNTKTEFLGELSNVKTEILIDNQDIKISQQSLYQKLQSIEDQNILNKTEVSNEINLQSENLKNIIQDNQETSLRKSNDIEDEILNLKSAIGSYDSNNTDGKNEILNRLSSLENSIDGLGNSIDNIGTPQTGTDLGDSLDGLNTGINTLNNTAQVGLIDENNKPYLKSLNENLLLQNQPIDDDQNPENDINSLIGGEMGYSLNRYSNLLGNGFCSAPSNINISLMGTSFTILDFSLLNPYVNYIRSVFLSVAYILGLFLFLRGK